jgi:hypothetical protein
MLATQVLAQETAREGGPKVPGSSECQPVSKKEGQRTASAGSQIGIIIDHSKAFWSASAEREREVITESCVLIPRR